MKPLRILFSPLLLRLLRPSVFVVDETTYSLYYHAYNTTWANERAVEVAFVKSVLDNASPGRYLEIGNVLAHYFTTHWDILDKFERGPNVINEDILTFRPAVQYDLIVSISTFEHIGYDDDSDDSARKIRSAWANVVANCLKDEGTAVITIPIGYNADMDDIVFRNLLSFDRVVFLKRTSRRNWMLVTADEAQGCVYGRPFPCANCVAIGVFQKTAD